MIHVATHLHGNSVAFLLADGSGVFLSYDTTVFQIYVTHPVVFHMCPSSLFGRERETRCMMVVNLAV